MGLVLCIFQICLPNLHAPKMHLLRACQIVYIDFAR